MKADQPRSLEEIFDAAFSMKPLKRWEILRLASHAKLLEEIAAEGRSLFEELEARQILHGADRKDRDEWQTRANNYQEKIDSYHRGNSKGGYNSGKKRKETAAVQWRDEATIILRGLYREGMAKTSLAELAEKQLPRSYYTILTYIRENWKEITTK